MYRGLLDREPLSSGQVFQGHVETPLHERSSECSAMKFHVAKGQRLLASAAKIVMTGEPYQHVDLTTDMPMLDRELGLQMTAANGCQQMRAPRVVFFTSRVGNSASWIWVFVRSSKSCEVLLSCVDSKVQDRP